MPDPALLDPNNRLLGWSTGDLSLYGGQPTVTLGAPRAVEPGGSFVSVPSALSPSPVSLPAATTLAASSDLTAMPVADDLVTPAPTALAAAPPISQPVAPAPSAPTPAVPDPIGSGSLAPAIVQLPLTAAADGIAAGEAPALASSGLGGSTLAAPQLDLAPAAAAPAAGGIAATLADLAIVAPLLERAAETGTGLVETTAATATDTLAATGDLLDGVVAVLPVAAVTATLAPAVSSITDAVANTAADTLAQTGDALVDVTDGVTGAATDTLATTGDVAAQTIDATATTVADLGEAVGGITAPLADAALAGTDPEGGVATLVGMVESADIFDLASAGAAASPLTEGGSILDALAADEAPGALLGVGDEGVGGLLGGDHHDDHDGGLLGGL